VQFKPFTGKLLMRGYEPWAGGLLDDQLPLTWTQVQVTLKEPNVVTMREIRAGEEEMMSRQDSSGSVSPGHYLNEGAYSLTLKLDKHTHVTEVKAKNYSTDPSKSIILDAFSIEKSKDWGVLPFEGIMYKRIKFGVPSPDTGVLAEFRTRVLDICEKEREIPDEIRSSFLGGLLNRLTT
jgi:hypothetical protein